MWKTTGRCDEEIMYLLKHVSRDKHDSKHFTSLTLTL